ncbi:MAG: DUF2231 domain-containing protein [Rudaea sp.]
MRPHVEPHRSVIAAAIFGIFNPIPFGCFVAGFVFDVVYFRTGEILWDKAAAWSIALGLVCAIVPRLINLSQVWITSRRWSTGADRFDFVLNLIAIVLAIVNSFVHSRDAYASMPAGVWLSALTVFLLIISHATSAVRAARQAYGHA